MNRIRTEDWEILIPEDYTLFHVPLSAAQVSRLKDKEIRSIVENQVKIRAADAGGTEKPWCVFDRLDTEIEVFMCLQGLPLKSRGGCTLPAFSLTKGVLRKSRQAGRRKEPETAGDKKILLLHGTLGRHTVYHAVTETMRTVYFDISGEGAEVSLGRVLDYLKREFECEVEVIEAGDVAEAGKQIRLPASFFVNKGMNLPLSQVMAVALAVCFLFSVKGIIADVQYARQQKQDLFKWYEQTERFREELNQAQRVKKLRQSLPPELFTAWEPVGLLKKIGREVFVRRSSWVESFELDRSCACISALTMNIYGGSVEQLKRVFQRIRSQCFPAASYAMDYKLLPSRERKGYIIRLSFRRKNNVPPTVEKGKKASRPYKRFTGLTHGSVSGRRQALPQKADTQYGENRAGDEGQVAKRKAGNHGNESKKLGQRLRSIAGRLFRGSIAYAAEKRNFTLPRPEARSYQGHRASKRTLQVIPGKAQTQRKYPPSWRDYTEIASLLESLKDQGKERNSLSDRGAGGGRKDPRVIKYSDTTLTDFMKNPLKPKAEKPRRLIIPMEPLTPPPALTLRMVGKNAVVVDVDGRQILLHKGKKGPEGLRVLRCDPVRGTARIRNRFSIQELRVQEPLPEWKVDLGAPREGEVTNGRGRKGVAW